MELAGSEDDPGWDTEELAADDDELGGDVDELCDSDKPFCNVYFEKKKENKNKLRISCHCTTVLVILW